MTPEQKAKAYNEALAKAKEQYNYPCMRSCMGILEEIFPELKESEDEKIRKDIIVLVKDWWDRVNKDNISTKEQMIAWLEKQGKHANFRNKIQIGDKVTRNEDGVLVNLSQLKRIAKPAEEYNITGIGSKHAEGKLAEKIKELNDTLEKQSKQKSADKVEPKFKVGDWIINPRTGLIKHIKNVLLCDNNGNYEFESSSMSIDSVDNSFRLWTIQDAKDGDVLITTFEEDNVIVMYHSMCTIDTINVHCCLDNKFTRANLGVFDVEDVKPATKEQRDILFQKMHEAGYEWNPETKELIVTQKKYKHDFEWCMECPHAMWMADAFEKPDVIYCTKYRKDIRKGDKGCHST